MAGSDDFFILIDRFDRSLGRLEKGLSSGPRKAGKENAAQGYVRESRRWLGQVIRADPKVMVSQEVTLHPLRQAVIRLEAFTPRKMKFGQLGRTIDGALVHTYETILPHALKLGIELNRPVTFDKTMSFLPGDPDFPTQDQGGSTPRPKPKPRIKNKTGSFLSGNSDFDTE